MKSVLKDRRLTFEKLKKVQEFLQTQEEPKFKALVSLEETLEEVLTEGTLSGQGYVDALLAIKASLNPVDREMFYMSSTSEFWRFYVRDEEIESILNPVADAQRIYIERLGGKVTPFMSGRTASELIDTLTNDPVACERASRIYEAEKAQPALPAQIQVIQEAGRPIPTGLTRGEAEKLIHRLPRYKELVTPRQQMVLRFWEEPNKASKGEASDWMDSFYRADGDHENAWRLWKEENPEVDASDDPNQVPLGVGRDYLQRVKAQKSFFKGRGLQEAGSPNYKALQTGCFALVRGIVAVFIILAIIGWIAEQLGWITERPSPKPKSITTQKPGNIPESNNIIDLNGFTYTVMRVSHTNHIGPWKAENGESYVVVDLKVKNPNPEIVTHDAEFQILDSEGTIRDRDPRITTYAKNGFFFEFTIKPKSSKPITLVFKVPEESLNQTWTLQIQNKNDKTSPGMIEVGSAAKALA
jgi:hypothetical protein